MTDTRVNWYGNDLLRQLRSNTPEALGEAGELLLKAAAARAPRAGGTLAASGYVATEEKSTYRADKLHNKEVKPPKGGAVVAFAAFYARFWEFGTSKLPAKPYLRPALDELKGQMGARVVATLGKKLR